MKNNKRFQKVFAMLMSFLLTAESVGFMTQGDTGPADGAVKLQSGEAASWAASIPDLLAAGKYEEGVVIAGIDMSGAGIPRPRRCINDSKCRGSVFGFQRDPVPGKRRGYLHRVH